MAEKLLILCVSTCLWRFTLKLNKVDDINPLDFYDFNQGVTRHADHKLYIKRCRINVRKYSFAFRTAKAWNALTIRTRRARSVDVFKRLLDLPPSSSFK